MAENAVMTETPIDGSRKSEYPLIESQLELWLASQQSDDASRAYNEIASIQLDGELDVDALMRALQQVVDRREMLRATFSADGDRTVIHDQLAFDYTYSDWSGKSDVEQSELSRALIAEEGATPFDLANGPMLRVRLQKLSDTQHKLTFTTHHIIMDGWSLWLFCRDLGHSYDAQRSGRPAEIPVPQSFQTYAEAMRAYHTSDEGAAAEAFWLRRFESGLPTLDLPTDRARPPLKTYSADRCDHILPADLIASLRKSGGSCGCSLFHTMFAGFNVFLARLSGEQDICVGIPTAGQSASGLEEVLGHCVNALPMRSAIDGAQSFVELSQRTRAEVLDAMDHQRYTFGTLLRKLAPPRDPSRTPIFQVMFNVDPEINAQELGFGGLCVEVSVEPRVRENFDWFVNGVIKQDGSVELQCQFNTDLFDRQTIAEWLESYEALLAHAAKSPETPVSELKMLSLRQAQRTLVDWNSTELPYPVEGTVHTEFARQAKATPDKIAVEFGQTHWTYRQLDERSNQLAHLLQSMSVAPGDLVGVSLQRSEQLLLTLLAVMKSGAGYVPLDPSYPHDRLSYMCQHSGLRLVVTEQALKEQVAAYGAPTMVLEDQMASMAEHSIDAIGTEVGPTDIAYVIYTSGSTGKPKGVQVPHGTVVNFLYGMKEQPGFGDNDRLLAVTTPSFDISVLEFYLPLIAGGQVVIADRETTADGARLAQLIDDASITVFQATPATWRMMIEAGWEGRSGLKALCGGEAMPVDLVDPLLHRVDELWNMYGPTETTVWSTMHQVTRADQILIGRPMANTHVYVLDANMQPVPTGVMGELLIGGAGVTRGYLNREDLTSERFIENPWFNPYASYVCNRLYRTGDVVRQRADGNLEFLRRNDKQVKVRGFRIELGEIEHQLRAHESVQQAIVIVYGDAGNARLVAYYIPDQQGATASELRAHLRDALPHYMIPQHFVEMDAFPKTNNGKINHNALPAPDGAIDSDAEYIAPETENEVTLAAIWGEALGVEQVGVNDNFFSLGGHSMLVMKVIANVEDQTGVRLSPQDFLMGTLEQLAMKLPGADNGQLDSGFATAIHGEADKLEDYAQSNPSSEGGRGLLSALRSMWS